MNEGDAQALFERLVDAGWAWQDEAIFAPNGTIWLDRAEPWVGDLPSLRERMIGRAARITNTMASLGATDAADAARSLADVESLISILSSMLLP